MDLRLPELRDCVSILYPLITIPQNAECRCLLGILYIILGFVKTWSAAARRSIWWLSTSPKSWRDRARKKQLPSRNTKTILKFRRNNFLSKFSVFAPFDANLLFKLMTFLISAFSSISRILVFFLLVVPDLNFTFFCKLILFRSGFYHIDLEVFLRTGELVFPEIVLQVYLDIL